MTATWDSSKNHRNLWCSLGPRQRDRVALAGLNRKMAAQVPGEFWRFRARRQHDQVTLHLAVATSSTPRA